MNISCRQASNAGSESLGEPARPEARMPKKMLILRGTTGYLPDENGKLHNYKKGALHEPAAKEYARRKGYEGAPIRDEAEYEYKASNFPGGNWDLVYKKNPQLSDPFVPRGVQNAKSEE